jgi:hypothetical protein
MSMAIGGSMPSKKKENKGSFLSPSVVHRLLRVVRLKHAPVRREGSDREVVLLLFVGGGCSKAERKRGGERT